MSAPKVEHPTAENARSPSETWRILFLDRAEHIEQLKAACKDVGYTVVGVATIKEAFVFLDGRDHADVIVCAAHLPEESMFEFLAAVRESEVHRAAMVLILDLNPGAAAARLHRSTKAAAIALGADTYAVMPTFDAQVLVALIQKLHRFTPMLQQSGSTHEKRRKD